jgi:hypothetical protein
VSVPKLSSLFNFSFHFIPAKNFTNTSSSSSPTTAEKVWRIIEKFNPKKRRKTKFMSEREGEKEKK